MTYMSVRPAAILSRVRRVAATIVFVTLAALLFAPVANAAAPLSTWYSPATGSYAGGTVQLKCMVSGTPAVTSVEFSLSGGTVLGMVGPAGGLATYNWDTTGINGTRTVRCRGFNSVWGAYASATLTIDNTAPTASVASPANNSGYNAGSISVATVATDTNGVVSASLFVDGTQYGSTQSFAAAANKSNVFSVNMAALSVGAHSVHVRYVDVGGNATNSSARTYYYDPIAPAGSIVNPVGGTLLGGTQTWTVSASDNAGISLIEWYVDGSSLRHFQSMSGTLPSAAATYSFSWGTSTESDGAHSLTALIYDSAGNVTATPAVGVNIDNTAPSASSITSPLTGSYQTGTITISTAGTDAVGVERADLFVDGTAVDSQVFASTLSASRDFSWDTTAVSPGAHSIKVRYYDFVGNYTDSTTITLIADNAGPAGSITAPLAAAYVRDATPWTVSASDDAGVTQVEWYVDGVLDTNQSAPGDFVAAADVTRTYIWDSAGVADGTHTLTAKVFDGIGNSALTDPVEVTADNTAPASASVDSPASGTVQEGTITVSTSGADNLGLAFANLYFDGELQQTIAASGLADTVDFEVDTGAFASAAYSVTVEYVDLAGGATTSSVTTLKFDQSDPAVTITAPESGSSFAGDFNFWVLATDDGGVTGVRWYVDGVITAFSNFASVPSTSRMITLGAELQEGAHTISAEAVDWTGKTTGTAESTVNIDFTSPDVSKIVAPVEMEWLQGTVSAPYQVSAEGADNLDLAYAYFYVDGVLRSTEPVSGTSATATWNWVTTGLSNGAHTVRVTMADKAGNTTNSTTTTVMVDNTAPGGSIKAPLTGATVKNPLDYTVQATDNYGVTKIEWFIDTTMLDRQEFDATTSTTRTYRWDPMTSAEGPRVLTAKIYDAAGNVKVTAAINVTVTWSIPCDFDPATSTITMALDVGNVASLYAETGGKIRSGSTSYCTGGDPVQNATVSNTDTIVVTGSTGDEVLTVNRNNFTTQRFTIGLGDGSDTLKVTQTTIGALVAGRDSATGKDLVGWGSTTDSEVNSSIEMTGVDTVHLTGSTANDELYGDFYASGLGHTCAGCDMPDPADYPLVINGGKGGDFIVGGLAADTIIGGTNGTIGSYDEVSYIGRTNPVTVTLDGAANDGEAGELDNVATDVEDVTGGSGDDSLTGSTSSNVLKGGPGGDTLVGGDGNDTLYGHWSGAGVDGSDSYAGGNGNDTFFDGSGSAGGETFVGGAGTDLARFDSRDADDLSISLDGVANDGATGENDNVGADIENIRTGDGDDTLTGSTGNNVLDGGAGSDTFSGGDGNDTFKKSDINGASNTPGDVVNGGNGTDTSMIWYASDNRNITVRMDGVANDGVLGEDDNIGNDVEIVYGADGDDTFVGNAFANRFYGDSGNDTMTGGDGADYMNGQYGDDTITGGTGNDKLYGDFGDDSLNGGSGTDTFAGGYGNDTIYARDSVKETVNGGPGGGDSAQKDAIDVVSYVESFF